MFYHMFGANIGALNVYLKPLSVPITSAKKIWKQAGDQGDMWRYGSATATYTGDDFQVLSKIA